MKARLHFPSKDDLREYLHQIGVPEQTTDKINSAHTFGEFTEAQLELARSAFSAEVELMQESRH